MNLKYVSNISLKVVQICSMHISNVNACKTKIIKTCQCSKTYIILKNMLTQAERNS